jgi:acyl-ACP thioesterase
MKVMVTLHTEQTATITLDVIADNITQVRQNSDYVREMALRKLDESGGAEWRTTYTDIDINEGV